MNLQNKKTNKKTNNDMYSMRNIFDKIIQLLQDMKLIFSNENDQESESESLKLKDIKHKLAFFELLLLEYFNPCTINRNKRIY